VNGVLVVDKPAGPTSHDVVDRVRKVFGVRRVGHAGTLDPFATGVLPVCLGKATRLVRFLSDDEKVYRATIRFGFFTSTDDLTGEVLGEPRPVRIERPALEAACRVFVGSIDQVPPLFSAKRTAGRRLYELARLGRAVPRSPARVFVHSLEVLALWEDRAEVEVRCSSGTYIRALSRDIGARLETGGHLVALRRLRSCGFGLDEAVSLEKITANPQALVLPISRLLLHLPAVKVGEEGARALAHGQDLTGKLVEGTWPEAPRVRILDGGGTLLALAVPGSSPAEAGWSRVLHPDVVLVG